MSYREAPVLRKKYCERAYTAAPGGSGWRETARRDRESNRSADRGRRRQPFASSPREAAGEALRYIANTRRRRAADKKRSEETPPERARPQRAYLCPAR